MPMNFEAKVHILHAYFKFQGSLSLCRLIQRSKRNWQIRREKYWRKLIGRRKLHCGMITTSLTLPMKIRQTMLQIV